jgi:periplasmic protein CpxP/Spy
MRKTISIGALAFAAVTVSMTATAQPPCARADDRSDSTFHNRRGPGGPGGPERTLLRGITLTDAQQRRVASLREAQRTAMDAQRDAGRGAFDELRAARERGDTAAANREFAELRAQMQSRRDAEVKALREVLTAEQRRQFDANVAEMKQRRAERGDRDRR